MDLCEREREIERERESVERVSALNIAMALDSRPSGWVRMMRPHVNNAAGDFGNGIPVQCH